MPFLDHGAIAPLRIDRFSSGITKSGDIFNLNPSPSHSEQAPNGELNENKLGSILGTENPETGHAKSCEKRISSLVAKRVNTLTLLTNLKDASKEAYNLSL